MTAISDGTHNKDEMKINTAAGIFAGDVKPSAIKENLNLPQMPITNIVFL